MAEAEQVVDEQVEGEEGLVSQAPEEAQRAARRMGWIPPEKYKGAPDKFIDADEYLKRGEEMLPILRADKRKLEGEVGSLSRKLAEQEAAIKAMRESTEAMEEYYKGDVKRKVEEARRKLKEQFAQASRDGDHEGMAEATESLSKLRDVEDEEEPAPRKRRAVAEEPNTFTPPAYMKEWMEENPWYGTDSRRTAMMHAISLEVAKEDLGLRNRDFLDEVARRLEEEMPSRRRGNPEKVSGGNGGSRRNGGGKTWADLPAEAKAACDSFADRLVGKGKKYTDAAAWRAKYVKDYFSEV